MATGSHLTEDEACVGQEIAILLEKEVWAGAEYGPDVVPPAPCRVGVCRFQPARQVAQPFFAECFAFESSHGWHVGTNISEPSPNPWYELVAVALRGAPTEQETS